MKAIPIAILLALHLVGGGATKTFRKDPALAKALGEHAAREVVLCGDDTLHLPTRSLEPHLFLGPGARAVYLQGMSGADLFDWQKEKTAAQINDAIKVMAQGARLLVGTRGAAVKDSGPPLLVDVSVPETIKDCREKGSKIFTCGSLNAPRACCDEGEMKIYGFQIVWKDPTSSGRWRLKYHPGRGNTVLIAEAQAAGEPLRYCAIDDPISFRK